MQRLFPRLCVPVNGGYGGRVSDSREGAAMVFEPNKLYLPSDDELRAIATKGTLAVWRTEGRGPAYIRLARTKVVYKGSDLNEWLEERTERPEGNAPRRRTSSKG